LNQHEIQSEKNEKCGIFFRFREWSFLSSASIKTHHSIV